MPQIIPEHLPTGPDSPQARPLGLTALTGLRIFPAVAVWLSHIDAPHGSPAILARVFQSGYAGVTCFFVLSGFVLAINYFERLRVPSVRGIWSFAVARFARVYPLYLVILLYFIVRQHLGHVSLNGWVEQLLAVQTWGPSVSRAYAFNAPAWSVGVELFLYATFPLLVLVIARLDRGLPWLLGIAVVVVAAMVALVIYFSASGRSALPPQDPGSAHRWLYRMPVTRLGDFILGIVMARVYLRLRHRVRALPLGSVLIAVGILASLALAASRRNALSAASWDLSFAVPSALLILGLALAPRNWVARLLATPFVVFLGEVSYAFYLCQWIVREWVGAGSAWSLNTTWWSIWYEIFNFGIVLCVACSLHLYVERPARVVIRNALDRWPLRTPGPELPANP